MNQTFLLCILCICLASVFYQKNFVHNGTINGCALLTTSPQWHAGLLNQHQDFEGDTTFYGTNFSEQIANIQTDNDVIVPESDIVMTPDQCHHLEQSINPQEEDGNHGINHYLNALDILRGFNFG